MNLKKTILLFLLVFSFSTHVNATKDDGGIYSTCEELTFLGSHASYMAILGSLIGGASSYINEGDILSNMKTGAELSLIMSIFHLTMIHTGNLNAFNSFVQQDDVPTWAKIVYGGIILPARPAMMTAKYLCNEI